MSEWIKRMGNELKYRAAKHHQCRQDIVPSVWLLFVYLFTEKYTNDLSSETQNVSTKLQNIAVDFDCVRRKIFFSLAEYYEGKQWMAHTIRW